MSSISINTRELASPCSGFCSQGSLQALHNSGSSGLLFGTWRVKEFEQSRDKSGPRYAVLWVMLMLEKPTCLILLKGLMSKKPRLEELPNKLVALTFQMKNFAKEEKI
nr:chaperone protein DnaJ A7A, chloroplastic-like [Tanacetum cinerariifolium]